MRVAKMYKNCSDDVYLVMESVCLLRQSYLLAEVSSAYRYTKLFPYITTHLLISIFNYVARKKIINKLFVLHTSKLNNK